MRHPVKEVWNTICTVTTQKRSTKYPHTRCQNAHIFVLCSIFFKVHHFHNQIHSIIKTIGQENSYWIDKLFHGIIILSFRAVIETLTQSSLILPIQRENFAWLAHTWLWFRGMFSSLFPISICILTGLMRESSFYWSVTTYDTSNLSSRNINIISKPYTISWNLKCLNFTEIGGELLRAYPGGL